jgi:hypothetical protein
MEDIVDDEGDGFGRGSQSVGEHLARLRKGLGDRVGAGRHTTPEASRQGRRQSPSRAVLAIRLVNHRPRR